MSNRIELKKIAQARLKSAKALMDVKDWHGAAYMLGYALECALKAVVCKTLHLVSYPEKTKNDKVNLFFMTHNFDQLLVVSGLSDIFNLKGSSAAAWKSWSDFRFEYQGDWPAMRYDLDVKWREKTVKKLYDCLVNPKNGVIPFIERRKRW